MEWSPLILTAKLALITTFLLLLIALPIAYFLAFRKSKWVILLETIFTLPLVLPPTVIGLYLLLAFNSESTLGHFLAQYFNLQFVFSFSGLVLASLIYSLPFMLQSLVSGFRNLPTNLIEAALVLGKNQFVTATKVLIPCIKNSIFSGIVLTFAHTIGEFGVILMIGGNIPEKTRVASIAIYNATEQLDYKLANQYALILLVSSFVLLFAMNTYHHYHTKKMNF